MYHAALPTIQKQIEAQCKNAKSISELLQFNKNVVETFYGENAFMVIARCNNPKSLQIEFAQRGIETATHFVHAIDWAETFGYKRGTCPMAEKLTKQLLMIPTYRKI
jgi:dTDP-4-amino-4,6-dideoxygalactose transaminase